VILTGRTGLIALLCVLPIALSPRPAASFTVLLALLAAAVVADVGLAASPSRLLYTRLPNGSVRLGESVNLGLLIHNSGRRRFRGRVRDAWPPSAQAEPPTHAVDIVSGQVQRVDTCMRPIRRGDQQSAAVTARSIGPLGLAGRQKSRPVPGQVRVLPPFLSRKHLPSRLARLREIDGLLPTLTRGQGTEFDSLREYVVGDDVRSIDWRATARRADVVVRTWRPERDRRVVIVLDTGRTSAGRVGVDPTAADPGGWPRLDWSMDAALLLAADNNQRIAGANRAARAALLLDDQRLQAGVSLWNLFERDHALFRRNDAVDIPTRLVIAGSDEAWPALLTPPGRSSGAGRSTASLALHTRPRSDVLAHLALQAPAPQARGGLPPAAMRRAAAHGAGWIGGGSSTAGYAALVEQVRQAWRDQGRTDRPRMMSLGYVSLGPDGRERADSYLRAYYAFAGPKAAMAAAGAITDAGRLRETIAAYAEAGCDELILFPCTTDAAQLELIATEALS